jgi:hypothetical protein
MKFLLFPVVTLSACTMGVDGAEDPPSQEAQLAASPLLGGFTASCWSIRLTNSCNQNSYCNLGASCRRIDGSTNDGAWWNLDNAISNENGWLRPYGNRFSETCTMIQLTSGRGPGVELFAFCKVGGTWNPSYLQLDDCLENIDGNLFWTCATE